MKIHSKRVYFFSSVLDGLVAGAVAIIHLQTGRIQPGSGAGGTAGTTTLVTTGGAPPGIGIGGAPPGIGTGGGTGLRLGENYTRNECNLSSSSLVASVFCQVLHSIRVYFSSSPLVSSVVF